MPGRAACQARCARESGRRARCSRAGPGAVCSIPTMAATNPTRPRMRTISVPTSVLCRLTDPFICMRPRTLRGVACCNGTLSCRSPATAASASGEAMRVALRREVAGGAMPRCGVTPPGFLSGRWPGRPGGDQVPTRFFARRCPTRVSSRELEATRISFETARPNER